MAGNESKELESAGWTGRNVSRGDLLKGMGALALGAGAGALLTESPSIARAAGSTEVIYSSWGGSWASVIDKAWFKPFTKATGIRVVVTGPPDYGKIEAMVSANNTEWDIAEVSPDFQFIGAKKNLLTPIDWTVVKRSNFLTGNPLLYNKYSVPQSLWSLVITWRTDKFGGRRPTKWADLWDTKRFPGRRILDSSTINDGTLEAALLADGVSPAKLYPLDVDRALKKLDEIKSDILWFNSGSQMIQYFQEGQGTIGTGWDGRINILKHQGAPVDYTFNQALMQWANFVVPRGAPHPDAAMKLLSFATQALPQARMVEGIEYGPVNPRAFGYLPKSLAPHISGNPQELRVSVPINWKWWADNYDMANAKFTSWLNG
jgi:putative spermidine/putrescine transport system substrate-binding protein